jgi:hypothetical protein
VAAGWKWEWEMEAEGLADEARGAQPTRPTSACWRLAGWLMAPGFWSADAADALCVVLLALFFSSSCSCSSIEYRITVPGGVKSRVSR